MCCSAVTLCLVASCFKLPGDRITSRAQLLTLLRIPVHCIDGCLQHRSGFPQRCFVGLALRTRRRDFFPGSIGIGLHLFRLYSLCPQPCPRLTKRPLLLCQSFLLYLSLCFCQLQVRHTRIELSAQIVDRSCGLVNARSQ